MESKDRQVMQCKSRSRLIRGTVEQLVVKKEGELLHLAQFKSEQPHLPIPAPHKALLPKLDLPLLLDLNILVVVNAKNNSANQLSF
jgi:hypothetical protein